MSTKSYARQSRKMGIASMLDAGFALLALFLPPLLSLPLLGTDLLGAHNAEFALGVSRLGIVQFPGYPLYLLATKLITWLMPYGSELWQINFASLFYASLASFLIFLTGRRLLFSPIISLAASLLFFFSPFLWQTALVSSQDTFYVFLITLCVYLTLGILISPISRHLKLKLSAWAFLCGLTGAQHPALIAWITTILVLGIALGVSRVRVRGSVYWVIILSALLGACLPYIYLPLRLLSPGALFNPDLISSPAMALPSSSWKSLFFWLVNYWVEGAQSMFVIDNFHMALKQFWQTIVHFALAYPFFPLIIIAFGLLLNLRTALLRQPGSIVSGLNSTSRLTLSILPLCALGGEILLLREHTQWTRLNLTLGCTYWSFIGLEYCHQILGHTDQHLTKIQQRLKPTWFALAVIVCVPLLAFVQSYGSLKNNIPAANKPNSTLNQATQFMKSLPENASLYFPTTQWRFPFTYIQSQMNVRPDLQFKSFSEPWADMRYNPVQFFHSLSQTPHQRFLQEITYSREWIRILSRKTRPGSDQFLLTRPIKPEPTFQFLLQSLMVTESFSPIGFWETPHQQKFLSVFRIHRRTDDYTPLQRRPPANSFISDFDGKIRLISGQLSNPVKQSHQLSLLNITLTWQLLSHLEDKNFRVLFQIVPSTGDPAHAITPPQKPLWKEARLLGLNRHKVRVQKRSILPETYQLVIPQEMNLGRYQVKIALQEKQSNRLLTTGEQLDLPVHFVSACEFWVVDSKSEGLSEAKP